MANLFSLSLVYNIKGQIDMKHLFCSYEQSAALKEIGFDEPCFAYYDEEDGGIEIYEYANCNRNVTGDRACYNDDFLSVTNTQLDKYGAFCSKDEEDLESFSRFAAPLKSQVFKWMRDNGIDCSIVLMRIDAWNEYQYVIFTLDEIVETGFNTYEEAEDSCINKLIELVKQKQ